MKVLALSALVAALCSSPVSAQVLNSTLGFGGVTPDLGCYTGLQAASRFPRTTYDPATHERIMSNVSACTGGFVRGWNEQTNRHWNADFYVTGASSGRDETGARWKFDPRSGLFTLLASGKTCTTPNLRHVCA